MLLRTIHDEKLAQTTYLIGCQRTEEAIVVDPGRDVERSLSLAHEHGLRIVAVAETHIHADFVSGARELAERVGATVHVSGEGGPDWQSAWVHDRVGGDTRSHRILRDGDRFSIGAVDFEVRHTPGHTPEHVCYLVTDRGGGATEPIGLLSGDFLFVGDLGRPDLLETAAGRTGEMEPAARSLRRSLGRLEDLPDHVQVWPGHGAGSACGKALGAVPSSTIGYERRFNPAIAAATSEDAFVSFILEGQPEPPLYFARMKQWNRDGPPVLGEPPRPPRRTAASLRELDGRRVAIIDTRPWDAFRVAHVPRSLSLPLGHAFPTDAGSMIDPAEEIHLIIAPDALEEAVTDLTRVGLDHIVAWYDASTLDAYEDGEHPLVDLLQLDVADAARMLDAGDLRVLDVRRASEFQEGHLPGAINIAHTRLAARLDDVPRGDRLLVHCRAGARSARASAYLQRAGYQVANLAGGILAWEQARAIAQAE